MVQGGGGEGRSPQLNRPNGGEAADHEGSRTARGHAREESDGERGPENPLTWLRGRMDTDGVPSLPSFLPPPNKQTKKCWVWISSLFTKWCLDGRLVSRPAIAPAPTLPSGF